MWWSQRKKVVQKKSKQKTHREALRQRKRLSPKKVTWHVLKRVGADG